MLPDTTKKQRSITTVGITRKRHIMLTPQAVMPSMREITPKKRERLTPRNTARSNIPERREGALQPRPRGLCHISHFWRLSSITRAP